MAKELEDLKQEVELLQSKIKLQAKYSAEGRDIDRETVKELKNRIKLQEEELERLTQKAGYNKEDAKAISASIKKNKELLSLYKEQGTAVGMLLSNISSVGYSVKEFLINTSKQYALAESIARVYKDVGKSIGMTGKSAERMEKSFKGALPNAIEMGFTADNLATIYTDISEATGRVSTLTEKDAETITNIAASMNLSTSEAAKMSESFMLMGLSTEKIEEHILSTYKSAQGMGLNATKVVKVLQQNMDSMQSYSFKGGVKGMTEMAKQAVKMRLDVSDVLQMADKFYQPEAAIEAAANLQMLGGDIAQAFGDPFETMYLARNKPEELAKKVGEMTENMMQFNEETGEYEMPAEVRMQLKAVEGQLGINVDKLTQMARQTSKIKDIKMKFSMSGLDEDTKDSIASLATFKDGRYVIEHDGKDLGLDEINEGMAEEIMQANQTESENLRDIAMNTQTLNQQMERFREATEAKIATATNIYEVMAEPLAKQLQAMKDGVDAMVTPYIKKASEFLQQELVSSNTSVIDDAFDEMGKLAKKIKDGVNPALDAFKTGLQGKTPDKDTGDSGMGSSTPDTDTEDMVSLPSSNGRVMTGSFGSLALDDRDLVVAGDPNKLLGGGNNSGTPSRMEFGNLNVSGRIEIVSPNGSTMNMDMATIKPQIEKMIINHMNGTFRDGGVPSSKQATDYMG